MLIENLTKQAITQLRRLKEMGIVQDDECRVCALKARGEDKQTEDLRHIWGNCGIIIPIPSGQFLVSLRDLPRIPTQGKLRSPRPPYC